MSEAHQVSSERLGGHGNMSDKPSLVLSTVIIQTSRMEKLASFYGRAFDLGEPQATGGDHLGFTLSNLYFGFDQVDEAPDPSGTVSIWFEVENLQSVFERFGDLGARVK